MAKHQKQQRFENLSQISRKRYSVVVELDWRYPQFFDWLQVSPSYRLAHRLAIGAVQYPPHRLPVDFDTVQKTYQAFGNVYRTYFSEWWFRTAQYRFGVSAQLQVDVLGRLAAKQSIDAELLKNFQDTLDGYLHSARVEQGEPATLFLAVPTDGSRKHILRQLTEIIDQELNGRTPVASPETWTLVKNKMREQTLRTAMRVLIQRCQFHDSPLYVIGNKSKFAPHHFTDSTLKKRAQIADARRNMEILTSRHLHRAYLLAENAARGKFPSLDPLPDDPRRPRFNYPRQKQYFINYVTWGRKRVAQIKEKRQRRRDLAAKKSSES